MAGTIGVIEIDVILRRQTIAIRLVEDAPPGDGVRAGALKMSAAGVEAAGIVVANQIGAHGGEVTDSWPGAESPFESFMISGSAGDLKFRTVVAGTLDGHKQRVELREIPDAGTGERIATWDQLYAGVLRLKRAQSRKRLRVFG